LRVASMRSVDVSFGDASSTILQCWGIPDLAWCKRAGTFLMGSDIILTDPLWTETVPRLSGRRQPKFSLGQQSGRLTCARVPLAQTDSLSHVKIRSPGRSDHSAACCASSREIVEWSL
jgi:hypothetical protein